ncbi:MAG: AAA family ATPase [Actinomycetota bacterium]|nr:AAA family ATPase [Actinomycetota bacterium]
MAAREAQVDYRLGSESVDSRQVWFLGEGVTAARLAYRPGEQLTLADGRIVRDAMYGIDRQTGERVRVRTERNRQARIAAGPYFSVIKEACELAEIHPEDLWPKRNLSSQLRSVARAAGRSNGTVVIRTAEALLRSNEHAWAMYWARDRQGLEFEPPPVQFDREEVMRLLGAHHRALEESCQQQVFDGKPLDYSLSDKKLGEWIWGRVLEQSEETSVVGNAGYELTLTCPKSFSVAAFVADPSTREQWLATVRDAARQAADGLMARVAHGRAGHEGDGQKSLPIRGLGYSATVSIESYSRELDPHLHGHVMIPNRVVCVDGVERTMATGGADLVNHSWWLQAQFERCLRQLSTQRGLVTGWEFDLADRQWEVIGADTDLMAFYSQAQARVHGETLESLHEESVGVTRARLQVLDSRAKRKVTSAKGEQTLTWGQVRARMIDRADEFGIDLGSAFGAVPLDFAQQPRAWDVDFWARTVEEIVCENKGAEITARIEAAVRAFAPHDWSEEQVRAMLSEVVAREFTTGEVTARGRVGVRKHASNRIADAERRACEAFAAASEQNKHALDPEAALLGLEQWRELSGWTQQSLSFTPGQLALFTQMTTGRDSVSTVIGAAGSGKTTAIDAARTVLAARGQRVYGVCVAAIAAQALRDTAGVQAGTVTWLTMRINFARDPQDPIRIKADELARSGRRRERALAQRICTRFSLPQMDHLVIDEASMIPATDMATVLEWAADNDITVTLIGDHRQLQPVGPSGLFRQFHESRPGAELVENLRQRTDVGRECAAFLRDGDPEQALLKLADAGQLVVVASQTEAERVLISAWAERAEGCPEPLERLHATGLESDRNDQVEILNTLARVEARNRGWITGGDVIFRDRGLTRSIAIGDQIVITKNITRGQNRSLSNGTRAVVASVDDKGIEIAYRDGDKVCTSHLTALQVMRNARHGYAMTTHKLQGQTVDSLVIDVGPDRDMSSAYVAFTRHRNDVLAVVNIADIADGEQAAALMAAGPDARRDAVIAMTAERMSQRGFIEQPTAHAALRRPLPLSPRPDQGLGMAG